MSTAVSRWHNKSPVKSETPHPLDLHFRALLAEGASKLTLV
jgi:hypothetical protein